MAQLDVETVLSKATSMNEDQMRMVLQAPSLTGGHSVHVRLSEKEYANADEIISDLAREMGLEYMKDIPYNDIPVDLVREIPINYSKQQGVLPFKEDGESIAVLTSNPVNMKALDDLRVLFKKRVKAIMVSTPKVNEAINKVYEKSTSNLAGLDEIADEDYDLDDPIIDLLEAGEDDAPVIKMVNSLLFRAVKERATDIHIEPFEKDMSVRFRMDGILFDIFKPPKKLQNAITSRIKVMANLNIAEKRLPQDGRIPLKVGGKDIDIRLSCVPTAFGERLVMRIQDRSNVVLDLDQLGFSQESLIKIDDLLQRTYGIILVTGPTGSGKSTTLYASLQKINNVGTCILTVEDPVEQRIHGVGQIQVNAKIGLTFASGLRSILRQDPEIIMIGEIRDLETAEIAINSSLTGHLVLSTLHTNDSAGAFPRLIDMGCEPFLIATSLLGVIAQRLVRVLCPHCKAPHEPSDVDLKALEVTRAQVANSNICKAVGCSQCNQKGYAGRTIIQELMMVNDDIRSLIMQRKDGATIKQKAVEMGMKTFRDHGIQKVLNGVTTIEEILTNTQMDV
jgi:general secretion pathway protein E